MRNGAKLNRRQLLAATALAWIFGAGQAQIVPAARSLRPNLAGQMRHPLRYRPEDRDFVITDGSEFFNRPLYGGPSAFRVDGGDKPEFVLYLPGRGGNLRLALARGEHVSWLHDAEKIVTRYRPGELHYQIGDLSVTAAAMLEGEGLILRIESTSDAELIAAFGGVTGERGARDGDIGTERVPIGEYFQFKPGFAEGNRIEIAPHGMTLTSPAATIFAKGASGWTIADGEEWNDLSALLKPAGAAISRSIALGRAALRPGVPVYLLFQVVRRAASPQLDVYREVSAPPEAQAPVPVLAAAPLREIFEANVNRIAALRDRVRIETPDPFINAASAALNVAADALWDGGAMLHGAIAWRTRLLGWRGPYVLDALGWHDRARQNIAFWASRQNTAPVPAAIPAGDERTHLARNETGLHSNGDLSNSHYDMNLVFIDALFRHLLWTGDRDLACQMWPVIERHLAWERRLFRREFGGLPLYEAYAAIWASDGIGYGGGGAACATAYNLFHNRMAARVAKWLGHDPSPYRHEATLIAKALNKLLWSEEKGALAEYKDWLGERRVHESFGLWSFYHAVDSGALNRRRAGRMADAIERDFAPIPVEGPGAPGDAPYHVYSTTNWMPYVWSVNNVVMAENLHTALALFQCGRAADAFTLMKGALLASMFMGISPGNVGTMNYLDAYRRESQRDFADGAGVLARVLVEGLFGLVPDAIAGELGVNPAFPEAWGKASITHPDLALRYTRAGGEERWTITQTGQRFRSLRLRLPVRGARAKSVTVNGRPHPWRNDPVGSLALRCPFDGATQIAVICERGRPVVQARRAPEKRPSAAHRDTAPLGPGLDVDLSHVFNARVTDIFRPDRYRTPRSPFVSLALPSQGAGSWAGQVDLLPEIDDSGLRSAGGVILPNGVSLRTPGPGTAPNIAFASHWDVYPSEMRIALSGRAKCAVLLMAGSTNAMQSRCLNGEVVFTYADGSTSRLALVNPQSWWPIEQDYFIDDYQFRLEGPLPLRVDLKTGRVRQLDEHGFKGQGGALPGGAATVYEQPLDPDKPLRHVTVRARANDVVIGLMALTLVCPSKEDARRSDIPTHVKKVGTE